MMGFPIIFFDFGIMGLQQISCANKRDFECIIEIERG